MASMHPKTTDLVDGSAETFRGGPLCGQTTELLHEYPATVGESRRDRDIVNAPSVNTSSHEIVEQQIERRLHELRICVDVNAARKTAIGTWSGIVHPDHNGASHEPDRSITKHRNRGRNCSRPSLNRSGINCRFWHKACTAVSRRDHAYLRE